MITRNSFALVSFTAAFAIASCLIASAVSFAAEQGGSIESRAHYKPDPTFKVAPAGEYKLDPQHSFLSFQVTHLGGLSRPILRFTVVQASYNWDPAHPEATKITARIMPNSLDSGNKDFDIRLNDRDMLRGSDIMTDGMGGRFRWMTFESTAVKFTDKNRGTIDGNLTLLGITKPVTFNFVYNGFLVYNSWPKMGFSATGSLRRSDWGMTAKPTAADDVTFLMEFEFVRTQPSTIEYMNEPRS